MKKISIIPNFLLIALIAFFSIIVSCKKDKTVDKTLSTDADYERAEFISNDAQDMSDAAANNSSTSNWRSSNAAQYAAFGQCATITRDSVNHIITIDFGITNCLCNDGRYRRGQVIVTHNGHYFDSGSVKIITFNNYYVNDHNVAGTRTVTNLGTDSAGNLSWSIVANLTITNPNGNTHTWNRTGTRTMIAGSQTPHDIFDDVYLITGSATGVNSNGDTFSMTITTPLRREISCHWIVSGTMDITRGTNPTRILDFGNGACDDQATVTVNGNTHSIMLH